VKVILRSLKLEAFRGLRNVQLDDLAPVNLVFGTNNSGKTSLLEAVGLVLRPFDPGQWVQVARQRDIDLDLVNGLWSLFPNANTPQYEQGILSSNSLRLAAAFAELPGGVWDRHVEATSSTKLSYDVEGNANAVVHIQVSVDATRHEMIFGKDQRAEPSKQKWLYRVFAVTPATHRQTRILVDHLSQIARSGRKEMVLEALRLFDSEIQDIEENSLPGGGQTILVSHKTRGMVELSSFGDGTRRVAALALTLARVSSGLLLIDEIESGIHISVLREVFGKLLRAALANDVQIVATTHSLEAMDALIAGTADVSSESLAGFYLTQRSGVHAVRRYGAEELAEFRAWGRDLR
jgi:predicted ATPase